MGQWAMSGCIVEIGRGCDDLQPWRGIDATADYVVVRRFFVCPALVRRCCSQSGAEHRQTGSPGALKGENGDERFPVRCVHQSPGDTHLTAASTKVRLQASHRERGFWHESVTTG